MSPAASGLDNECVVFARYLAGAEPSEYVRRKYRDGHRAIPYATGAPYDAFDVALAIVAARGRLRARVADSYARRFRPHGILRQKLTLLLAILENTAGHRRFTAGGRGAVAAVLSIGWNLAAFALAFVAGVLLFGLPHFFLRGRRPAPRRVAS